MDYWDALNVFLEQVSRFEIPRNPMSRVKLLAKEIAQGALQGVWGTSDFAASRVYQEYAKRRWDNAAPDFHLLVQIGYLSHPVGGKVKIEKPAFDLVEQSPPVDVFISYSHQESSPFALLILHSLNKIGLYPFLDMAIPKGDDWEARIKAEIEKRGYFVAVLGRNTLKSEMVRKEITWASEKGKIIIPVWHNGFSHRSNPFGLDQDIFKSLNGKQAIRVIEKSGSGYQKAIDELLNRFGVTP